MDGVMPWLAIVAIATVVQTVVVVIALVWAVWTWRRAAETWLRLERDELVPLMARVYRALAAVESIADRVNSADDSVRRAIGRSSNRVARAASYVRASLQPVAALREGVLAAAAAWFAARPRHPPREAARTPRRMDDDEDARFVYEGGLDHARR